MQMPGQTVAQSRQRREAEIALPAVTSPPAQRQLVGAARLEVTIGKICKTQKGRLFWSLIIRAAL
jgi:hypothetical protein